MPFGSPFSSFDEPNAVEIAKVFPNGGAPNLDKLAEINDIAARYQELDGIQGCQNDRIFGCPPYVCCLPGICCLGGCCALTMHTKGKIVQMRDDIQGALEPTNGKWKLCAGEHKSLVDMSQVSHDPGAQHHRGPQTTSVVQVWLEVTA